jgi:hypothetical protein
VRAASPEQKDRQHTIAKSSRRIRQSAFKHQSAPDHHGDDESADERRWPKLSRASSQDQRGASTTTRKANNERNPSFENPGTSEDEDASEGTQAAPAPMQCRKSHPGAHRWPRRREDHENKVLCDADADGEHTPYNFTTCAVTPIGDLLQESGDHDVVPSSNLVQIKASFTAKSRTPSAKPRTRRAKPTMQCNGKVGPPPPPSYLYGRATPHQTDNICVGCLGRRSEELEHEPIIFCDA